MHNAICFGTDPKHAVVQIMGHEWDKNGFIDEIKKHAEKNNNPKNKLVIAALHDPNLMLYL